MSNNYEVRFVNVGKIRPDPEQPRKHFDEEGLEELYRSIKENGLKNPIHVKPSSDGDGTFLIVAGERRWRAMKKNRQAKIPAFVMAANTDALVFGLVDNLNRENLNPMEEAHGFAKLIERGLNQTDVARRVGRSQGHVSNMLLLTELPPAIQEFVAKRKLPAVAGYNLVRWCRDHQENILEVWKVFRKATDGSSTKLTAGQISGFLQRRERQKRLLREGLDEAGLARRELGRILLPLTTRFFSILDELASLKHESKKFNQVLEAVPASERAKLRHTLEAIGQRLSMVLELLE